MKNTINQDLCKKCMLCIEVCPVNMIGKDSKGNINFIAERESICLECGQCMAICSTDAIKVSQYSYDENLFPLPEHKIDAQSFTDFIASRRSVRNFREKPVEKELIEKALESLCYTPSGAEPYKVEITVVNDREKIEKVLPLIEKFLDNVVKWVESPFVSRIIKMKKGSETFNTLKHHLYPMAKKENYKLKYGDRISRGASALIILHADQGAEEHTHNSLIYATYISFALHSLGLGGTINGIIPAAINKDPQIKSYFNIPENHEAVISIMFGYPKYKYKKMIKRAPKKTHWI